MSNKRAQDDTRYCERCGISYIWTVEEQKQAAADEAGARPAPTLCPGCRALLPGPGRERGLVKWYNIRKRYGFLVRHGRPDLFVPAASLLGQKFLQTGDLVEFGVGRNNEGPIAQEVRVILPADNESTVPCPA